MRKSPRDKQDREGEEGSVFVACSTLCFAREPLEKALRQIAELEFDKFELAIVEDGQHLRPSEVGDDPEAALQRLRRGAQPDALGDPPRLRPGRLERPAPSAAGSRPSAASPRR